MTRIAAIFQRDLGEASSAGISSLLRSFELPANQVTRTASAVGFLAGSTSAAEGVDAPGPARHAASATSILFDGRLDNREELLARMGRGSDGADLSDAEIVLERYLISGEAALRELLGPFAIIVHEERERRLLLVRDPLGSRCLHYVATPALVLATTRADGLLGLPGARYKLDEASIARFLSLRGPEPGSTFWDGIKEVAPGFLLEIDERRILRRRFDEIRPNPLPQTSEEDLEEMFRELLSKAVRVRMRGARRVGIQMSGGLDSTSVAAMAARLPSAERLSSISYVFRELKSIDETRWIEAVASRCQLDATLFSGDEEWPLKDGQVGPDSLASPVRNLYWRLRARVLAEANARGIDVLLTGEFSDELWQGGVGWLNRLVRSGRLFSAASGLVRLAAFEARGLPPAYSLRASVASLLRPHVPARQAKAARRHAPWLTAEGREVSGLAGQNSLVEDGLEGLPPGVQGLLSPLQLAHLAESDDVADRSGMSIRHPYRDRRLVEFLTSLPPELVYRPGARKLLMRRAMADYLPSFVVNRTAMTPMTPLCDRGLGEREWPWVRDLLAAPDALWPQWVDPKIFWSAIPACFRDQRESIYRVLAWNCVSLELWRKRQTPEVAQLTAPG